MNFQAHNMGSQEVNWAIIAQNWIQMKETYPQQSMPMAPPAPIIKMNEEFEVVQGEQDMDCEKEDEVTAPPAINPIIPWNAGLWNQQMSQPPPQVIPQVWKQNVWTTAPPFQKQSLLPTPVESVNVYSVAKPQHQHKPQPQPWKNKFSNAPVNDMLMIPTLASIHTDAPNLVPEDMTLDNSDNEDSTPTLDNAQRKLLPAWIREGLEKMEREKQREVERIQELHEHKLLMEQRKKDEELALRELELEKGIVKSKFDSDGESSDEVVEEPKFIEKKPNSSQVQIPKEVQVDMMASVRRNLTEILLEVTSMMIQEICVETVAKYRKKAPTVTLSKNAQNALTSLTGLGLGIYSGSSDEDSNGEETQDEKAIDSDIELKERYLKRQASFEIKAREIEAKIEMEEKREMKMRQDVKHQDSSDSEDTHVRHFEDIQRPRKQDGEIQEKFEIYSISGQKREKKASRFSDPNDTVRTTHVTHVAIVDKQGKSADNGTVEKSKNSAHSSPSSSSSGHKKHKKHKKSSKKKKSSKHDGSDEERRRDRKKRERPRTNSERHSIESRSSTASHSRSERSRARISRSKSRDRYRNKGSRRSRSRSKDRKTSSSRRR